MSKIGENLGGHCHWSVGVWAKRPNLTDLVCSPRLVGGNADIIPSTSCVQNDAYKRDGDDHHDDHDGKRTSGSDDNDDHAMPSRTS